MKSNHFLAMALVGSGLSVMGLAGGGCGSSSVSTTGSGGTSSSTTTGTGNKTTSSTTAVTTGSGGAGGAAGTNHSFATATPIMVDATAATPDTLANTSTANYYSFTGTAGQRLLIEATAHNSANASDTSDDITDTVVTLYLPDMATEYAQDDDSWPRFNTDSQLFVELPMAGTYYYTVQDCNSAFTSGCAPAGDVTIFDFATDVIDLTAEKAEVVGVLQGGTAPAVTYTQASGQPTGTWDIEFLDGDFAALGDTQVISFTGPANTAVQAGLRTRASMWLQPISAKNGDGSYANVQLTVKDANGNVVAQADQANYKDGDNQTDGPLELSFPLFDTTAQTIPAAAPSTLGKAYTLEIKNEALSYKQYTNYYFMQHAMGSVDFGQAEVEFPGAHSNDTGATAEVLKVPTGATGAYFADGNLVNTTGVPDVDWYSITLTAGTKTFQIECDAGRAGSGLLGFTAQVFSDALGTTSLIKLTEANPPVVDLMDSTAGAGIAIPTGVTTLYLETSATGQSATNTGSYYKCGIYLGT